MRSIYLYWWYITVYFIRGGFITLHTANSLPFEVIIIFRGCDTKWLIMSVRIGSSWWLWIKIHLRKDEKKATFQLDHVTCMWYILVWGINLPPMYSMKSQNKHFTFLHKEKLDIWWY